MWFQNIITILNNNIGCEQRPKSQLIKKLFIIVVTLVMDVTVRTPYANAITIIMA